MNTTTLTALKVLPIILLAICMTLVFLAGTHGAQTLLASVGWHGHC